MKPGITNQASFGIGWRDNERAARLEDGIMNGKNGSDVNSEHHFLCV